MIQHQTRPHRSSSASLTGFRKLSAERSLRNQNRQQIANSAPQIGDTNVIYHISESTVIQAVGNILHVAAIDVYKPTT